MKAIKPEERRFLIGKPQSKKAVNTDSIESLTPETDKKVIGTFLNVECPGQTAAVSCMLYRGMQYFTKVFADGERATIPQSVARFINERCGYEKHSYLQDEAGRPIKMPTLTPRYKFMIEGIV